MSSYDQSNGDVFGQIFLGSQLEQAAIDMLKDWFETYTVELQQQINWTGNDIPPPRSWTTRNHFDRFPEDQLPAIIVVSPGLAGKPVKDGTQRYRTVWDLAIAVICSARDEPSTKSLARFYCGVVRAIMVQHRSLGGIASGLEWVDESYDEIMDEQDTARVLASGQVSFRIEVDGTVSGRGGPRVPLAPIEPGTDGWTSSGRFPLPDPDTQPGSTFPVVETVNVTLNKEAL